MTTAEIIAIVVSAVSVLTSILALYLARRDRRDDKLDYKINESLERLEKYEKEGRRHEKVCDQKVAVLEAKVDALWNGVMKKVADALISPHTPELDKLLQKFRDDEPITESERLRLVDLLMQTIQEEKTKKDKGDRGRAALAAILLGRLSHGH